MWAAAVGELAGVASATLDPRSSPTTGLASLRLIRSRRSSVPPSVYR